MYLKKIFLGLACLGILGFGISRANAMTVDEINVKITELQNMITKLQAQLSAIPSQTTNLQTTTPNTSGWCYNFVNKLKYKDSGKDVEALQTVLRKEGLYSGKIGGNLGTLTFNSVIKFQKKYLTPYGLALGTGFVGDATLKKLNKLYGCAGDIERCTTDADCKSIASHCNNGACSTSPECQNLWWYDNNSTSCAYKSFCDAYMYQGLNTFFSSIECNAFLNNRVCPAVCVQLWQIENNSCVFHSCESGCAKADGITSFGNETDCKAKLNQKSITITSPNGGEQWQIGKTYDITWKANNVERVNIYIIYSSSNPSGLVCARYCTLPGCSPCGDEKLIASNIDASLKKYSWKVNSDIRSSYRILIISAEDDKGLANQISLSDLSDGYFNIVAPTDTTKSITVTSPNGGEQWQIGKTYDITWTATDLSTASIYIDVSCSDKYGGITGKSFASLIDPSLGKYSWTVPIDMIISDKCKVSIGATSTVENVSFVKDESNNYFSIVSNLALSGGQCNYKPYSGTCTITKVDMSASSVSFKFFPSTKPMDLEGTWADISGETALLNQGFQQYPGYLNLPCLKGIYPITLEDLNKCDVVIDSTFKCNLNLITSGSCSPEAFDFWKAKADSSLEMAIWLKRTTTTDQSVTQKIFIYLDTIPTPSQTAELNSMGITIYPDSWIPAVGSHPYGLLLAVMPISKLEELEKKDYVKRLGDAEQTASFNGF